MKSFRKIWLIFILALMSSIAPLSTDMYLPALSQVQISFNTSSFLTQLSLASFFSAFALGQLIYGPLSDVFGRKKPALIGISLFIISSFLCIVIDNIYVFIALRFVEALGGCAGVVIARAIVNDLFDTQEAVGIFALMMVVSSLAPMLSPTFGGILLEYFSWHSIFACLFILGVILFFMIAFGLKETVRHNARQSFSYRDTAIKYGSVFKDKQFIIFIFSAAFALGAMFAYITGSSFVFIQVFGLSKQQYAMLFGINALGFVILANVNVRLVKKISCKKMLSLGFILMLIAVFLLVVSSFFISNFWLFETCLFLSIACLGFIAPNTTALAMARFKNIAGTASAVLGTTQFALAGFISFMVGLLNANTPFVLAFVMFVCVVIANLIYYSGFMKANYSH